MSFTVENSHKVIIVETSILSDRCPQLIAAFVIFQSCTLIVEDIVIECDVVGKDKILVLVRRVLVRHHIGEIGKMLGGLNPVRIPLRTVAAAEGRFRFACWITPRVSRKTYTLPSRHKQQEEAHND